MLRKFIFTSLCIALLSFGCGGSTPQPESAESESNNNDSLDGTGQSEGDAYGAGSTDPETTEEVIETSDPLD